MKKEIKKEFIYTFQLSKLVIFTVKYNTVGSNATPYFATSSARFIKSKRDFERCGQCQNDVLSGSALEFYKKYDNLHLKDLTLSEYNKIIIDIEILKNKYNYINSDSFYNQVELSKMNLKNK